MIRWSADAPIRPHRCALLPHVTARSAGGFFSAGTTLAGEHVYVSGVAARELAESLGYVPARNRALQDERIAKVSAERDQALAEVAALQARLDAVEVLKLGGAVPARKPGRPKKAAGVAA